MGKMRRLALRRGEIVHRLGALEALAQRYGDGGGAYVADISSDPPRYWIDGREVDVQTFRQRAPVGPFVVDIGEVGNEAD